MSDLFHEEVSFEFIDQIFEVIHSTPHHIYQILTKRADRMAEYFTSRSVPQNALIGVSVEDKDHGLPRIDHLRSVKTNVRFISVEPLPENLGEMNLTDIHWITNIQIQCNNDNVAFFFKQWGGWGADGKKRSKKENGRLLSGKVWDQMPETQEVLL